MVDASLAPSLSDELVELGACSVDVTDAKAGTVDETPIFGEPGEETEATFGANRVVALFASEPEARDAIAAVRVTGRGPFYPRMSEVPDQDWVRLTQSQFEPIRISPRLWIVPSWHAAPDPDGINIVLDPGLAFGTGSHPTTRLCLEWLDSHPVRGQSVIDYGCGSGILAIAAAKLGASSVRGIDIDGQAVLSSRHNAAQNDAAAEFSDATSTPTEPADIVLANILANPLKVLAPLLAKLTRPGGTVVLSGILLPQAGEMNDIYKQWFEMELPFAADGWVRLAGRRKA